ncbi:MAG: glucosyl-3-phosphoglycerate synthase [Acidimicrobiales bacterium]
MDTPLLKTFPNTYAIDELLATKQTTTVSVCLPARNEGATLSPILATLTNLSQLGLIDEVIVVNDRSSDDTVAVARAAGVTVVNSESLLEAPGGKGDAMWCGLQKSQGDIVCWCDADVTNFGPHFISQLLGPLFNDPLIEFTKGYFERPIAGQADQGGRTTALMALPILSRFFSHLTQFQQPLGGEYAGRRSLLERMPFVSGYGVDIALLIDICNDIGIERMAQVDLGSRQHRNRSLDELAPQAMQVLEAVLQRAGISPSRDIATLYVPGRAQNVVVGQRPPVAGLQLAR